MSATPSTPTSTMKEAEYRRLWKLVNAYASARRNPINGPDPSGDAAFNALGHALRSLVEAQPSAVAGEANECRIELVTAIHGLASQVENTLYAFGADAEARRQAEGAIKHALKVAGRWNWNGAWPAPSAVLPLKGGVPPYDTRQFSNLSNQAHGFARPLPGGVPTGLVFAGERRPLDAEELEAVAKKRPNDFFLKGSGVLKLIGAVRQLEQELRDQRAAPSAGAPSSQEPTDAQMLDWLEAWHGIAGKPEGYGDTGIAYIDRVSDGFMLDDELGGGTFEKLRDALRAAMKESPHG